MAQYKDRINRNIADFRMYALMMEASEKYGIPFYFDKELNYSSLAGVTRMKGFKPVAVGMNNFSAYTRAADKGFIKQHITGTMPTEIHLHQVWALKHEEGHVQRGKSITKGVDNDLNARIACESCASAYNPVYYSAYGDDGRANMFGMCSEIDAQRAAVQPFYDYCYNLYGDAELADKLTVEQVANDNYGFVKENPNIHTHQDIINHYNNILEQAEVENWRVYPNQNEVPDHEQVFGKEPDYVDQWFDKNMPDDFDRSTFPDYFPTSKDTDKFVMAATNDILKDKGAAVTLEDEANSTPCLHFEKFQWDTSVYRNMFQTEEPNQQFYTDEYVRGEERKMLHSLIGDKAYERDFPNASREERINSFKSYSDETVTEGVMQDSEEESSFASMMQEKMDFTQSLADSKGLSGMDAPDMDIDLGL